MNMETTNETVNNPADETTEGSQAPERMFTKEEVNDIVTKRLQRAKRQQEKTTADPQTEADLLARASRLDCREYLIDNGLPSGLLDVVDTSDLEAFKTKVSELDKLYKQAVPRYPSVKDGGEVLNLDKGVDSAIKKAFSKNAAHVPKQPRY